jgi:hypothetical protein
MNSSTSVFRSVTPLLPAGESLSEALRFFRESLGFSIVWQSESMAGVSRDSVVLNLVENNNQEWAKNASYSFGVSDIELLYAEYKEIPARIGPLEMKPWGRREFHMIISSGVCLQFYEQS